MIQIIGNRLTQWDVGRFVQVTGDATHVHFANQGDSKAVIIEITEGQAKIPDYLLQSCKTVYAYAVLDGVTLESVSFSVTKRERPENYVYEDDTRNYIYELIANAENAIEASEAAAGNANEAAAKADEATASATDAAGNANKAADNANTAADKAVRAAGTFLVVGTAKGERIVLTDAAEQYLIGCRIFGKSTQDGVPTPDAPVEIESVEDPTLSVNTQSMVVPYTLHGIPVTSGGNYIDANGQQWICDEVDFGRGIYVQRVHIKAFDGTEGWVYENNNKYFMLSHSVLGSKAVGLCCSSHFSRGLTSDSGVFFVGSAGVAFYHTATSVSEWKAFLSKQFTNGTPVKLLCVLATPIETPLTDEEIAAYKALYTSRGTTTISNDESAHMEIQYVMDAKKYIDSLVAGPAARLAWVTLEASAWKGENSLYSQVVTIDGVTPYSKVDLLPSEEQLAIFRNKDVAFVTKNEDGVVTVYAIGQKPVLDYTMQAQITEVVV